MKTIRRNQKLAREVFETARVAYAFTLSGCFVAREVAPSVAQQELVDFSFAKLVEVKPGHYRVRVHSNCWYELWTVCATCELRDKAQRNYGGQAVRDALSVAPECSC